MGTIRCSWAGVIRFLYGILCWIFRKNGSQGEGRMMMPGFFNDGFCPFPLDSVEPSRFHLSAYMYMYMVVTGCCH